MKRTIKTPEGPFDPAGIDSDEEGFNSSEPAHHARRPMNAFLIFCKRHRSVVRERYPSLENRCITKILGEWWAQLEPQEKACYTELAKQYKEAFLRANPDFKWYKLPAPPLRTLVTRPSNQKPPRMECPLTTGPIVPGKLADESQMGGLSSLLSSPPMTPTSPSVPKPPKKRYLEETFSSTGHSSTASGPNWDTLQPEKSEHSRSNSPDSDGKDSGLCTLSPTISTTGSTGLGPGWAGLLSTNTTTVQASQQQLIERVVDRMCSSFTPLLTTAQPAWNPQGIETNNNETTCVNVNPGTSKDDEGETVETEKEEQDATPECKQSYSEADSGLSSREDLTLGMGMLGMGGSTAEDEDEGQCQASTSAEGRRKSLRACKGKRYQEFMSTGRLASGKRSARSQVTPTSESAAMQERKRRHDSGSSTASEKTDSAFSEGSRGSRDPDEMSLKEKNTPLPEREPEHTPKKRRRLSETSEESYSDSSVRKRFRAADFNLDEKIEALPSLSLEEFQQKKKAKKKRILCSPVTPRKNMIVRDRSPPPETEGASEESLHSPNKTPLVGSQKRKARRPPTRLDPNSPHSARDTSVVEPEVLNTIGLATLAEVASAKRRLIK